MTDHSIVSPPGSARGSAAATQAGPDFGPRSMRMASPVNTDPPGALHRTLRAATRSDHALLDRSILRFDLTRRDHYGLFLQLHCSALRDLEADWSAEDDTDLTSMLRCVQGDLRALRIATPASSPGIRAPLHPHGRLGVAYVLRGSRLGAQFLRRRVPRQYPAAYLDFMPALPWAEFLMQLESSDAPGARHDHEIVRGARIAFETFIGVFNRAVLDRSTPYGTGG
jgi:heme oxygenase (biliverdin-IX-beta and delta-forming)